MSRSKNLGEAQIQTIVRMLDGWSGPLSWNLLIGAVEARLNSRYTRQALHKHLRIRVAFGVRKVSVDRDELRPSGSVKVQKALERIARLENEKERLQRENDLLLEQFARWSYNAYVRGLGEADLNRPLPEIDRRRTPVLVHSATRASKN